MGSVLLIFVSSLFLVGLPPSLVDFFLLLFDKKGFHRVVVVVIPHQKRQFPLFRQRWSLDLFVLAFAILDLLALFLHDILPPDLELLLIFVIPCLVPRVVNSHQAAGNICASEVIYSEVGAPLIFVL